MSSYRESALKILLAADVLFENSDGVADREGCWGVSNRPEGQALIDVGGSVKPNTRRWRGVRHVSSATTTMARRKRKKVVRWRMQKPEKANE